MLKGFYALQRGSKYEKINLRPRVSNDIHILYDARFVLGNATCAEYFRGFMCPILHDIKAARSYAEIRLNKAIIVI